MISTLKGYKAAIVVGILLAGGLGGIVLLKNYVNRKTSSAPSLVSTASNELAIRYYLTVQKMDKGTATGDPFNVSGREVLASGWKFRFNFSSPQQGFLYLLSESTNSSHNSTVFYLLFPSTKDATAQLPANQKHSLGWFMLDENEGTEEVWVIWSIQPLPELEAIKGRVATQEAKGVVNEPFDVYPIKSLIKKYEASNLETDTETVKDMTGLRVRGDILLYPIMISHAK